MGKTDHLRANKAKIIADYESGTSTPKIAKEYGCDAKLVYKILEENKITIRKLYKFPKSAKERYYHLIKYLSDIENKSRAKIAETLNIGEWLVKDAFKDLKIDSSKRKYTVDRKIAPEVIKLYQQGFASTLIADKFGVHFSTVFDILEEMGIEARHTKKYTFKEDILDNGINTPELAWLWGIWLADGNVNIRGPKVEMCDEDVVQKSKNIFEYTGPILSIVRGKNKKIYRLQIGSVNLAKKFINLGCMPAKSHSITMPNHIPGNLLPHFIRGLIDGDGSINKTNVTLTSNLPLLEGVRDVVIENIGLKEEDFHFYERNPERNTKIRCMMLTKVCTTKPFLDWLYAESAEHMRMNRKYDLYVKHWKNREIPQP